MFLIKSLGDSFERTTASRHFKDASDNGCFGLIDFQANLAIGCSYSVVSEATASGVLPIQNFSFKTSMRLGVDLEWTPILRQPVNP